LPLPAKIGLLGYTELPTNFTDLCDVFHGTQRIDDLLFRPFSTGRGAAISEFIQPKD